jgi:hypothetical protein
MNSSFCDVSPLPSVRIGEVPRASCRDRWWRSRHLEVLQRDPPAADEAPEAHLTPVLTERAIDAEPQQQQPFPMPVQKAPAAPKLQSAKAAVVLPSRGPGGELDSRKLAMVLQTQLARLGCYRGSIDGDWGRLSRRAVGEFSRATGTSLGAKQPNLQAFSAVTGRRGVVCQTRRIVTRLAIPATE